MLDKQQTDDGAAVRTVAIVCAALLFALVPMSATQARPVAASPAAALTPAPAPPQEQRTPAQLQALARRHMELAVPGPEHERLAALAGTWDIEISMWPQPGAAPVKMNGVVEAEAILDGRFLVQTADVSDLDASGAMMTILGFDRRADEYTLIGLDTSGTYWVTAQGPADASGDRAVLSGEDYDAIFEGTQLYDFVLEWPDADTMRTQIIFKDDVHTRGGPPFKMVETVSRRRR